MSHDAFDGSTSPKYAIPRHLDIVEILASLDTNSDTKLGEITGTTGGIGSLKLLSANSTSCSHDIDIGLATAGGYDACEHDTDISRNKAVAAS